MKKELDSLAKEVLALCSREGWDTGWEGRGVYLHLEASELIEAMRGKNGTVLDEAGDVLFVLMSITESQGIPFIDVIRHLQQKIRK